MTKQIELKGTGWDVNQMASFKTFEEFYKWADPIFKGEKKDFEAVYYSYHPKPKQKAE